MKPNPMTMPKSATNQPDEFTRFHYSPPEKDWDICAKTQNTMAVEPINGNSTEPAFSQRHENVLVLRRHGSAVGT